MSTLIDPFEAGVLPVELTAAAKRKVGNQNELMLLSLLLANLAAIPSHGYASVAVTPVLDTSAYATGDTLFDRTAIPGAVRVAGASSILRSLSLLDKDDQTAAQIDLFFLSANVAFGTLNAAPSISDANAAKILGKVSVLSTDFIDVTGSKIASLSGLNIIVTPDTGTSIYVAAITRGSPTQTASGILLNFGFEQE